MLKMPEFKTVRGMRDFLPDEAHLLRCIENRAREVARLYGYREIVTPLVESYELLSAKAGEEVKSRMFAFKDLGGRDVALRPEFTASVARLVATTLRNEPKPFRLFCLGSIYRYDEPQRGRYREFWQSNYELVGSAKPEADAEILMLTNSLMQAAGLKKFTFKVGHIGILRAIMTQERLSEKTQNAVLQQMDKKQYEDALSLIQDAGGSENCAATLQKLVKLKGTDVYEVVDGIVKLVKSYKASVEAAKNLAEALTLVSKSGSNMNISVEAGFARGLEYYTGMIFEVYAPGLDVALGGGGRYDRLIELFGGESTPAVGVAHGIDRMMLALKGQEATRRVREKKSVLVIPVRDEFRAEALRVSLMLRDAGVPVEVEVMGRKIAKALEDADRREMAYAVIIGERELREGAVVVRNLANREQSTVKVEDVVEAVKG
jgi:histidyl-tRNA synthetase